MIIEFNKSIRLDDWYSPDDPTGKIMWYRKLIPYADYDSTILVGVYAVDIKYCYANFYSQLAFLHKYFPSQFEGNLDFAKQFVDNFLIKMSGLTAFI